MHNPESVLENETHKLLWDFGIQTDHLISARRPDLMILNKKKKNLLNSGLNRPANHWVNWRKAKRKMNTQTLLENWKKSWNMKVTVRPIVIGPLDTVNKGLVQGLEDMEIRGRVDTIQTTALLSSARILKRVLVTWRNLLSLRLQWKTITYRWCKNKLSNQ